jgi:arabinofuranosyltransferase
VAARHVLTCPAIADLLDAVDSKLTPGRFLSNLWHSVDYTTLEVPADPIEAERRYCPA